MSQILSKNTVQTEPEASIDVDPIDRRELLTKLVAAAALAATGLVSGEANAEAKAANRAPVELADKTMKWNESQKVFKDSTIKFLKLTTGFRVEIHATAELGATIRSMGLVPAGGDAGPVKLSIEFSG